MTGGWEVSESVVDVVDAFHGVCSAAPAYVELINIARDTLINSREAPWRVRPETAPAATVHSQDSLSHRTPPSWTHL